MQDLTLNTILVPIDFSETSLNALDTAIAIARRQEAHLILLHVYSTTVGVAYPEGGVVVDFDFYEIKDARTNNINALAKKISTEQAIDCQGFVVLGAVCPAIIKEASQINADLIVMGTHGASGLREFFIRTNAYTVLRNAPCPVLTVPPHHKWENFKKILFPVRPIANALEKYCVARNIIRINGSELIVMSLLEKGSNYTFDTLYETSTNLVNKIREDNCSIVTTFFHCDSFAQKILDQIKGFKADLVIITATLDYRIQDFFIGPFAQQVVNHAQVPVLSIRPASVPISCLSCWFLA